MNTCRSLPSYSLENSTKKIKFQKKLQIHNKNRKKLSKDIKIFKDSVRTKNLEKLQNNQSALEKLCDDIRNLKMNILQAEKKYQEQSEQFTKKCRTLLFKNDKENMQQLERRQQKQSENEESLKMQTYTQFLASQNYTRRKDYSKQISHQPEEKPQFKLPSFITQKSSSDYFQVSNLAEQNERKHKQQMIQRRLNQRKRKCDQQVIPTQNTQRMSLMEYPRGIYYMKNVWQYCYNGEFRDYFSELYTSHFDETFQAAKYCLLREAIDQQTIDENMVDLPPIDRSIKKKTFVFDMDETLIHCLTHLEELEHEGDIKINMKFEEGFEVQSSIMIRPFALEIIKYLKTKAELILFTASQSDYANPIINFLDPNGDIFDYKFFRDKCLTAPDGRYVKDLRIFKNRDLKDMVLIDNSAFSFGAQVENGIPVIPFFYNKEDEELKSLLKYLKLILESYDVRTFNKEAFKLHQSAKFETAYDMLESIFE